MENASAFPQFRGLVPGSEDSVCSWVEDGLGQADEEADGDDVIRGLRRSKAERQNRPDELARRDPN